MSVHDGRKRRPSGASQASDGNHHDDYSLINPFAPPSSGNIRNRRASPTSAAASTESSIYAFLSEDSFNSNSASSQSRQNDQHFLELETSPPPSPRHRAMNDHLHSTTMRVPEDDDADLLGTGLEPMRTQSGLLLTHRQTPSKKSATTHSNASSNTTSGSSKPAGYAYAYPSSDRIPLKKTLEMDWGYYDDDNRNNSSRLPHEHGVTLERAKKMLSMAKVWIVLFCLILVIGTSAVWHSSHHESKTMAATTTELNYKSSRSSSAVEQIILVPLATNATQYQAIAGRQALRLPLSAEGTSLVKSPIKGSTKSASQTGIRRALRELRTEFDDWVVEHEKRYHSHDEKERRFSVWSHNHHRTVAKNKRHGPCKMTKQPVFGSNLFKDLTTDEFQSRFLTGYHGPKTDELHALHQKKEPIAEQHRHKKKMRQTSPGSGQVLDADKRGGPLNAVERHSKVQEKYEAKLKEDFQGKRRKLGFSANYSNGCVWYDISCWLRWFVNNYAYRIGGTMEPSYDSDSYPSSIDWRDMGVVTAIHSQGNCGACWAITGVETIESAYAIYKGTLVDLAETEVIICDDTCDMCEGGWPQNAYEYTMEQGGLPSENSYSYDGDYLLALTYAKNGESDEYTSDYYTEAVQNTCPAGSGNSNDKNDNNNGGASRYGNIKGYGYTTDRCICYTDGTGCDCDEQNEKLAVMNVATYGPATVCLDASLWQDYAGGIITSEIGCSSAFLDMNHCVQAVGYAYVDSSGNGEEGDQSGSGSGSNDSDDGDREGYWIIRNQWSQNWGMYGYIYVAMGANTCGVLNDMTHVYMK